MFRLDGKTILVTGGNSGLGFGFAQGCAKQGARIVLWGRRSDRNTAAARALEALGAPSVSTAVVDVREEQQVLAAFEAALSESSQIDCVFANAGAAGVAPSFPDMTTAEYQSIIAVNQHGAFYTLREACRHMRTRADKGKPGGSLVLCGSLSMFGGVKGLEHYAASKGAMRAMLNGIAVEMAAYEVRANMIAFGYFETEMTGPASSQQSVAVAERTPLKRVGSISDVHGLAVFLASDESSFLTGQVICLDGGRSAAHR